ncbi:hypothetical protein TNCV_5058071 [Trichonephila clavipes]|nr:hypothetical protein TNCV_5058071 [Trichonephila clavipes]
MVQHQRRSYSRINDTEPPSYRSPNMCYQGNCRYTWASAKSGFEPQAVLGISQALSPLNPGPTSMQGVDYAPDLVSSGEKKIDKKSNIVQDAPLKAQTVLKNEQNVGFRCGLRKSIPLLTNLLKTNFDIVAKFKTRGASGNCQVIYSQFGLTIHQNDHQARCRFVEWAQNEIAVVPDFHKRILFSDEAHFWLNGYVNKQNCRIWSEANPQVYVETPLHPEKLTVWCDLWAGGILLQKR